ncbi:porin [Thalassococcus sp. S3]|uniref:porin n=1 Tax=Thalassococcus sp. S3 TaxID=2017482 RepID=UPI0010248D40|nr:porin [Thalassococcus sp. S3]QBF33795.1 porin [Thalassococcus sp. S3]
MRTLALATTALVMGASTAMADVRISGYGRFGLDYNEANEDTVAGETNITSRLRLQFDMSAETDGGITFGARFRAQAESRDGVANGADFNGARFFASVGGFTLQVGNIAGALDSMQGLYLETRSTGIGLDGADFISLVTNVGDRNTNYDNWDAYSSGGSGRNGVEVIYEQGPFGAHLSYSKDNDVAVGPPVIEGLERTAVSGYYEFGNWTASLGYQDSNAVGEDKIVAAIFGDLGLFGVRFAYAQNQDAGINAQGQRVDVDKFGLYGSYDIGAATTLVGFVTSEDNPDDLYDGTGYGLHVSHDLGGGVSIEAGAAQGSDDITTVQAGVWFSF